MNQVYNQLLMKQKQNEIMQQQGRQKYEYDSDEDTEVNNKAHFIIPWTDEIRVYQ